MSTLKYGVDKSSGGCWAQKIFFVVGMRALPKNARKYAHFAGKARTVFGFAPMSKKWAREFYETIFHKVYTIFANLLKSCKDPSILSGRELTCALCRI